MTNLLPAILPLLTAVLLFPAAGTATSQGPKNLEGTRLDNLAAFARLVGYLRYFHPSDEAANSDWKLVAIEGIKAIENADGPADLAKRLQQFFRPIAPSLRVFPTGTKPALPKLEEGPRLMIWRHLSVPPVRSKDTNSSVRIDIRKEKLNLGKAKNLPPPPDPTKPFEAEIGAGVSIWMPLAIYADASGTLPRGENGAFQAKANGGTPSGKDRATRLAAVILAWNAMQHTYPYFDVVNTDWPAALRDGLARAATDADNVAFLTTLRRLLSALRDGHGAVFYAKTPTPYLPPIRWARIEDKFVVLRVAKEAADGAQPGDIVLKVDGAPADKAIAKAMEEAPGATPWYRERAALGILAMGDKDSVLELELKTRNGDARTVKLKRTMTSKEFLDFHSEPRPEPVCELKPGIWYVALDMIDEKTFAATLPKLEKAKGIIFDMRMMLRMALPLEHLCDKSISGPPVFLPVILYPDRKDMTFIEGRSFTMTPKTPRLKGKIAFITDVRSISSAESMLAMVQHYKLGAIVGAPTAGTNGNIRPVSLPGGYDIWMTGIKVLNYDGSQFHGRGIQPDVPVSRTINGVTEGRDEFLERALKVVNG